MKLIFSPMLFWTRFCTVLKFSLFQGKNDVQMLRFTKEGNLDILRFLPCKESLDYSAFEVSTRRNKIGQKQAPRHPVAQLSGFPSQLGLLEVCACLLSHFELLGKLPPSHIGMRHVEEEQTFILQAMKQPLKRHMATLHF